MDGKTSTVKSGNGYAGITVGMGTTLKIEGTNAGKLIETDGKNGAGIGSNGTGDNKTPNNKIIINGGVITATGRTDQSDKGAGTSIGTEMHSSCGDIEINGGTIEAHGGMGVLGIGSARDDFSVPFGDVGNIKITSGNIHAYSDGHGAGIGGGWGLASSETQNGTIEISGGTINASSTTHDTGIGAGCLCDRLLQTERSLPQVTAKAQVSAHPGVADVKTVLKLRWCHNKIEAPKCLRKKNKLIKVPMTAI